jgi:hypothetical protein
MKTVKVRPLRAIAGWPQTEWIDISKRDWDSTPVTLETTFKYWEVLHQIMEAEPLFEPYRMNHGELAALGIEKGKPFAPRRATERDPRRGGEPGQRADARAVLRRPPPGAHHMAGS